MVVMASKVAAAIVEVVVGMGDPGATNKVVTVAEVTTETQGEGEDMEEVTINLW